MKTPAALGTLVALFALSACGEPHMEQRLAPEDQQAGQVEQETHQTPGLADEPLPDAGINTMPPSGAQPELGDAQPSDQVAPPGFQPAPQPPPRE